MVEMSGCVEQVAVNPQQEEALFYGLLIFFKNDSDAQ